MKYLLFLALVAFAAADKVRYDGYSIWEVSSADPQFIRESIDKHYLDVWSRRRDSIRFLLSPQQQAVFNIDLLKAGLTYDVVVKNIQEKIDYDDKLREIQPKVYSPDVFNTWVDIDAKMQQVAADVPSASLVNIGTTNEGRPLQYLAFSTGGGKQAVWIDSGIHAREWMAVSTGMDMIERAERGDDAQMNLLLNRYDVHVMPVVNPDGYAFTEIARLWRKNRVPVVGSTCIGVDNNRNFEYMWEVNGGSSDDPCQADFRGPSAASELETQAVQTQLLNGNYAGVISVHAEAYMMMYAWGYTCNNITDQADVHAPAQKGADDAFEVRGGTFAVGSICNVIYQATGGTVDYAYGQAGIKYSYTPEVADGDWDTFEPPVEEIVPTRAETFALMYGTFMAIP